MNAALRERRDALVEALREHIPEAEFVVPEGGYFLWLDLNDDVDTKVLLAEAKEEGVTFVAGPDFMMEGGDSSLRLSFAPVPAQDVEEGVQRLARAWSAPARARRAPRPPRPAPQDFPGSPVEIQILCARSDRACGAARCGVPRSPWRSRPACARRGCGR